MLVSLAMFRWYREAKTYRDDISAVIVYLDPLHNHMRQYQVSSADLIDDALDVTESVQYKGRDLDPSGPASFLESMPLVLEF
jgi:hypothetical protein